MANRGKPQKYLQIALQIREMLAGGNPGDPLLPERALACHFHCNHLTVRKALRVLNLEGLIHTLPGKGSFLGAAENLSDQVGFIFPDDEIFYYRIFAAVEKVLVSKGLHPVVHLTASSPLRENKLLDYFEDLRVCCLIAAPNRECLERYRTLKIPALFFDVPAEGLEIPQIVTDDRSGACHAVEALLKLGHTRIAHIGNEYDFTGEQRLSGYFDAYIKSGMEPDRSLILMRYPSKEWGYYAARELFSGKRPPTAVFCSNDTIASGVVQFCGENHLSIPGDCSVIGYGNTPTAEFLNLSSVSQNTDKISGAICMNLEKILHHQFPAERTLIPTLFIPRSSIGKPAKKTTQKRN